VFTVRRTLRIVPAAFLLVGCSGDDLVLPGDGEPAAIQIVRGDAQSGRVGVMLAQPVVARVTDSQDRPVIGAPVAFAFTGDPSGATVAPDTAMTDGDGQAVFRIVLGTRVGGAAAEVRVVTISGERVLSAPLRFDAVSSDANQMSAVAGDGQSAAAGTALPDSLVVQVTDAFGNPISGVEVAWAADAGSVTPSATMTGADGLVSAVRTLGAAAGVQHATASAPGLAGSPVTFTHTATSGSATVLERVSGDGQSALAGTSVPEPLVVRAKDGSGNPVADLAVTWVIGSGGGSLAPETGLTDAQGRASTRWTLGVTPGANTATAVVSGVGTVGFTATGSPGVPPALALVTEPPQTAEHGVAFSRRPVIQLRDPDGGARHLGGVAVSVSLVEGGGTLRGSSTRSTGGDGRVEFDDLAIEGPSGAYTLAFTATGYSGVRSGTIRLSRVRTTVAILADDPDPSAPGAPVRVRFQVRSLGGTPTGTVRVSADDGTGCEASVADGECTLAPTTVGSRTLTAAYSGTAEFESSSASTAHLVVAAPTQASTTTSITADDPDPSAVGEAVTVRFSVTAVAGAPAGTVTVTASGGGSCTATVAQGACDLTLPTEGNQTLTAVYAGSQSFAGSSDTEPHAVAVPSLSLRRQPSPTANSGKPFRHQPELQLLKADGKPLERSGVTVTASLVPGSGSLTGTVALATDDKGRVKFRDLGIDGPPGIYAIHFSADGFAAVTSDSIELR
jgi:large repetitive protein